VKWYRAISEKTTDPAALTSRQIRDYEQAALAHGGVWAQDSTTRS
jgi:hypothetical protein